MTDLMTASWPEGLAPNPSVWTFPFVDGIVLWNEADDEVAHLNPTAALVWQTIVDGEPLADLGERFGGAHPDGPAGIRRDVSELVDRLRADGLVLDDSGGANAGRSIDTDAAGAANPDDSDAGPEPPGEPGAPQVRSRGRVGLERAIEHHLADRDWAPPLGPYELAGYRFEIVSEDAALVPGLAAAFVGLAVAGPTDDHDPPGPALGASADWSRGSTDPAAATPAADAPARVWIRRRRNERIPYAVIHADRRAALVQDVTGAVLETLRDLSRHVLTRAPTLALHAAAVADEHGAVVVVGRSGAGKSTLGAALTASGLHYVADETVVIDPAALTVAPVLRPVKLERGGVAVFDHLVAGRGLGDRLRPVNDEGTLRVAAPGAAAAGPVPVRTIVFSRVEPDGADELVPLEPADALRRLLENRYATGLDAPDQLDTLTRLVMSARNWSLTRADLGTAVDLVRTAHHG